MSWRSLRLGEAFRVKHGFAFKSQYFADSGEFVVLTPGNFNEQGGFRRRPEKDRYYNGDIPEDFILDEGALIIAMTEQGPGLLGSSAIIPNGAKYLHNQRLGLVEDLNETILEKRFLYYLFNTRSVRAQISASASGTKVKHTAPERIYRVTVDVPKDVNSQRKIASVLSAYDDLIVNNRRRIHLLEQSARLLYREWFVHLRFPGHEHVKVVDGVPEGWTKPSLGEVINLKRGYDLPDRLREPGVVPIVSSSGVSGSHNVAKVKAPGVVTGRYGTLGLVYLVRRDYWPLNTSLYVQDFKDHDCVFVFHLLTQLLQGKQSDKAAVPGVNRNDLHRVGVLLPPSQLQHVYSETVTPMHDQAAVLELQNEKLSQARDLLLPRLMNGELII